MTSCFFCFAEFWLSPSAFPSSQVPATKPNKPVMPLPTSIPRPHLSTFSSPTSPPPKDGHVLSPTLSTSTSSLTSPTSTKPNSPLSKETSPIKRTAQRPQPPPRWYTSSPPMNGSNHNTTTVTVNPPPSNNSPPITSSSLKTTSNFTVTTTVTFHVNQCTSVLPVQTAESSGNSDEVATSESSVSQVGSNSRFLEPPLKASTTTSTRRSCSGGKTEDISPVPSIESPPGYHCSSLADKISDYEDIWVCTPSPGHAPESGISTVALSEDVEVDDNGQRVDGEGSESSEELKVIKTLKTLGLTGSLASSHNWEYSTSAVNQTDQEKVLARNSQTISEAAGEEHPTDNCKEQKKSRTNLGLVIVSTPVVPCLNIPVTQTRDECSLRINNPSPFYSEPIDSLNAVTTKSTSAHQSVVELKRSSGRFVGHRHSDPNILCPSVSSGSGQDNDSKIVITTSEPKIFYNRETVGGKPYGFQRPSFLIPNQKLSSSLSDLHSTVKTTDSEPSGGFVNVAFRSSSSQLSAARGTTKLSVTSGQQSTISSLNGVKEGSATLPRTQAKNTLQQALLRDFPDLATDFSSSVATTLTKTPGKSVNESLWRVDSSWAWFSRHCSSLPSESDSSSEDDFFLSNAADEEEAGLVQLRNKGTKFPVIRPSGAYIPSSFLNNSGDSSSIVVTVEELLTQKLPQLKVPEIKPLTASNLLRVSEYDNLDSDDDREKVIKEETSLATGTGIVTSVPNFQRQNVRNSDMSSKISSVTNGDLIDVQKHRFLRVPRGTSKIRQVPSEAGSSMTEFSEPWDSSWWEKVLLGGATTNYKFQSSNENKTRKTIFAEEVIKSHRRTSLTREVLNVKDNNLNNIILDVKRPVEDKEDKDEILTVKAEQMSFIDEDLQSVSTITNDNEALDADFANSPEQLQKIPGNSLDQ